MCNTKMECGNKFYSSLLGKSGKWGLLRAFSIHGCVVECSLFFESSRVNRFYIN